MTMVLESRRRKFPGVNSVFQDLFSFQSCFLEIERSPRNDAIRVVRLAIKAAHQMKKRHSSFFHHLDSLSSSHITRTSSSEAVISNDSNYWRISRDLARICTSNRRYRSCRPLFNHLTLDVVPHHSSVSSALSREEGSHPLSCRTFAGYLLPY